jgi:hypothetical protein
MALLALVASSAFAAEKVSYTRLCASCGIWGADTIVSHSGQFVVHGGAAPRVRPREFGTNSPALITIEPQTLAVTAERAKKAFLQELLAGDAFQDKVHAVVLDLAPPNQPIQLVSEIYLDGFQYRILAPGRVEHTRLVRALVQALMAEFANRGSRRCAELPRWLVEGMTRQVLASAVPTYVVNEEAAAVEVLGYDRLSYTRAFLSTNSPMSVQELSFYNGAAQDEERFAASAHLMVHELLKLKGGPALMSQLLRTLPNALNWQTAFYHVYRAHFATPLAFEKWWMLAWMDQQNRPGQELWPRDVGVARLDALLLTPLEVRMDTNSIPQRKDATLQEVIERAGFATQKEIFSHTVQELFFASMNLPKELREVAEAYQQALADYLQKRAVNEYQPGLKYDPAQREQALIKATLARLSELDQARKDVAEGRPPKRGALARRR